MTAVVASSVAPIVYSELMNAMLRLPEPDFRKLVCIRLNVPAAQSQIEELKITDAELSQREYWTEDRLIEEIFLQLAQTKQTIITADDNRHVTIYKYYSQVCRLRPWIAVADPTPSFIVDVSDLTARILADLGTVDDPKVLLKQAIGRLFENIDARQYHLSIARILKMRLQK
jgi:hypothetical protein